MKRVALRRRRLYRPPPRPATERVEPLTAMEVFHRDAGCVAVILGESPAACRGRLTLDHVKDEPRAAKRADSDLGHMVSLCEGHHLDTKAGANWATSHRPELRAYLVRVNGTP